jgi:hypothetical protein
MRLVAGLLALWLVIGVLAAFQRGYFDRAGDAGCAEAGTILVTVVAGPLNYVGANPRISCDVDVPQPSR